MNKRMKLGASLAAILTVTSLSAVEIGPTGSGIELSGYVDLLFLSEEDSPGRDNSFDTSQVEINLDFENGPVYFNVDIDFTADSAVENNAYLEEAVVGYNFGNGFGLSAGRSLSYLGWEAYDQPNKYQISNAYDQIGGQDIYDGYRDGGMASYSSDQFAASVWLGFGGEDPGDSAIWEYMLAFTGVENLVVKAILADAPEDHEIHTIWASYTYGDFMLAAEVAEKDKDIATAAKPDIEGWLVMGAYSVTDKLGLTLRYSEEEIGPEAGPSGDFEKITVSPNYAITDELSGRIEYSSTDLSAGNDVDLFAAELIYRF